ncbi:MAG: hypothetical protein ACI83P_001836 [Janthinobacterium sp.]|jgi:hypothetical protein
MNTFGFYRRSVEIFALRPALRLKNCFWPIFRAFLTIFASFRPRQADFPYIADKRQPKIVAIRVRLYAAKVNIICALTCARPTKRALRSPQHLGEEPLCHILAEPAVAIGAQCRMIPCSLVDIHAHEPALEQVVLNVLDKLPLRTNREQALEKTGAQQALKRNRWAAALRIHRRKVGTHAGQNAIDQNAQLAQRMRLGNPFFQSALAVQGVLADVGLAHGVRRKSCSSYTTYTLGKQLTGAWDFSTAC